MTKPDLHELKIDPEYFKAVRAGKKRAELRKADRDYKPGDYIKFMEYDRELQEYTGYAQHAVITHVCDVSEWLPGYVMISIDKDL